jgi:hypothetical protein
MFIVDLQYKMSSVVASYRYREHVRMGEHSHSIDFILCTSKEMQQKGADINPE